MKKHLSFLIFLTVTLGFLASCGTGPKAGPGTEVTMHYKIGASNYTYRSTFEDDPVTFNFDQTGLLPAIKEKIKGLRAGQSKKFEIAKEKAFGEKNPALIKELPRSAFPAENITVGKRFVGKATDGKVYNGEIIEANRNAVVLDLNHPLAGHDVWVEVKIIKVK